MSNETAIVPVTIHNNNNTAIERRPRTVAPLDFTEEDQRIIRTSICPEASDAEFSALIKIAMLRRLNPLLQQIHFVKRNQQIDGKWIQRWAAQISIDGFRSKAEETGLYDGQDEPEFIYDANERLIFCKVRIYKKGISRPFVGVAHFTEYAQYTRDGHLTKMWSEKPHVMLAKCAEAQGHRKAFPDELSGLYAPEEMGNDESRGFIDVTPDAPTLDPEPEAPTPQAPRETIAQQTARLISLCSNVTVASQLTAVKKEGTSMPRGRDRDRVIAAFEVAVARLRAAKAQNGGGERAGDREPGAEG
jgi:phage recombination protein Bet